MTSVDKMVPWSTNQAQALFTMTVVAPGGGRGSADAGAEMQVVAQLLQSDDEILVCSYAAAQQLSRGGSVERVAAGAGAGGVRVVDGEALLLDGVDEVDGGALDVGRAHPVDGQRRRHRNRRSGRRRGCGRRRTGCSAGLRSRPAARRYAAPGHRDPPGQGVPWPCAAAALGQHRTVGLGGGVVLNSHCILLEIPGRASACIRAVVNGTLFARYSRAASSQPAAVRRARPRSWASASSIAPLHRAGEVGDRVRRRRSPPGRAPSAPA